MHSDVQISNLLYCYRKFDGDRGSKIRFCTLHNICIEIFLIPHLVNVGILCSTSILDTFDYVIETQTYYHHYYNIVADKVHGNII